MQKKAYTIILATALVILAALFMVTDRDVTQHNKKLPPPAISFLDINGTAYQLSQFRGKIILVHFWASWCAPCVKEFPALINLAAQHADKITILAVSVDNKKQAIKEFIRKIISDENSLPENILLIHDIDKIIAHKTFHSVNYPETYIIGCGYTIDEKVIGAEMDWAARIQPHINACGKS